MHLNFSPFGHAFSATARAASLLSAPIRVVREIMSCPVTTRSPGNFALRPLIYRLRKLLKGPTRELEHITPQIYTYSADDSDTPTTTTRSHPSLAVRDISRETQLGGVIR